MTNIIFLDEIDNEMYEVDVTGIEYPLLYIRKAHKQFVKVVERRTKLSNIEVKILRKIVKNNKYM